MRNSFKKIKTNSGVSLIEIVIASAIMSVTLVSLVSVYSAIEKYSFANVRSLKAIELAEEAGEVLRFMRDSGWTANIASLTNGTTYRTYWTGTAWTISTTAPLIESKYDVSFVLSAVNRDTNYNVVSSGGTLDTSSRKALISVAWKENNATSTKTSEEYLFNVFNN